MKRFLLLLILAAASVAPARAQQTITAQQVNTQQLTLSAQNPVPPPTNVQISSSVAGSSTYYYWIVTHSGSEVSAPVGPFIAANAPATLGGIYSNSIVWMPAVSGATYDLLRTTTSATPTGACGCAVSSGITSSSFTDGLTSTTAYTVSTSADQVSLVCTNIGGCQLSNSCLLLGNQYGVLIENPAGTCYDDSTFTWDPSSHQFQVGNSNSQSGNNYLFSVGFGNSSTGSAGGSVGSFLFGIQNTFAGGIYGGADFYAFGNNNSLGESTSNFSEQFIFGESNSLSNCHDCFLIGANGVLNESSFIGLGLSTNPEFRIFEPDGVDVQVGTLPQTLTKWGSCVAAGEGTYASITDSKTTILGATITGGGSNHVFGYCNGTNWIVAAAASASGTSILSFTNATIASNVSVSANTQTSLISSTITLPGGCGSNCRALISYSVYVYGGTYGMSWLSDGTHSGGMSFCGTVNNNFSFCSGSWTTPVTYSSNPTFTLYFIDNGSSTACTASVGSSPCTAPSGLSNIPTVPSSMQISMVASN
jgi:hypothetical protein